MERQTFSLKFNIRRNKLNKAGLAPIIVRINVNGRRAELSLKRYLHPDRWDDVKERQVGNSETAKALNSYIESVRAKFFRHHQVFIDKDKPITANGLKRAYTGLDKVSKSFVSLFQEHNDQMEKLVGIEYANGTAVRYKTTLSHLIDFLTRTQSRDDIFFYELDLKFITDFEFYLKTVRACNHNTAVKYVKNLRKIVNLAIANDLIDKDPFLKYRVKLQQTKRVFLTEEELHQLEKKRFEIERLEEVRDIFIFCCYTGYSYADVEKLTQDHIVTGMDGEKWIITDRKKTNVKSNVPLLPKAMEIIERYKEHPICEIKGVILPVKSNQKYNAYLKEVADLSGITKNLTSHVARHTFATTVTLTNGVPLETVSSMLGHTSLRTTQIYAKVVEKKVSQEMLALREKLEEKSKENLTDG